MANDAIFFVSVENCNIKRSIVETILNYRRIVHNNTKELSTS